MKLYPPTADKDLYIGLTTGHTLVIPPDGIEVPKMFVREAISLGATPEQGAQSADIGTQVLARQLAVREALEAMIAGANKEDFTADGSPNLMRLKARAGFAVSRDEADTIFAELKPT